MTIEVRPAREEDLDVIATWASDTFEWGDYVPRRLPGWLQDSGGIVLVVADDADRPVALCHAVMVSGREGWLEAARVHPDHQRRGLGSALNHAAVEWLSKRGAQVVRLAVESDNEKARRQVEKLGYRRSCLWQGGDLVVEPPARCPPALRLQPVSPSEIDAAWVFWSGSDLAAAGRELIPNGWQWRRARPEDLIEAARHGSLYQAPAGWVAVRQPETGWLQTTFLATAAEDAPRLLDALHDLALQARAEEVTVKMPATPWAAEALARAGASPKEIVVYARVPGETSTTGRP